mgnify:CR=1 FL=1
MLSLSDDSSVLHDNDLIGFCNRAQPVRDDENGFPADDFGNRGVHFFFVFRIDERGRFVKNDHRRVFQERPRQRNPLAFASREHFPTVAGRGIEAGREPFEKLVALRAMSRFEDFFAARLRTPDPDIFI